MRHVRDQLVDAIAVKIRTDFPGFGGRVFAEGQAYIDDAGATVVWDDKTYPAASVFSGSTAIFPISQHEGYRLERRTQEISVAIGVREYEGEEAVDELSDLLAGVEDAVIAFESEEYVESVEVRGISPIARREDDDGDIAATVLTVTVDYYTQHGISGQFVAG